MAEMCGATRTKKYDILLSHLDFKYVKTCEDVKELEKILKVLRSGEEGNYPDLEKDVAEKLTKLNPNSKVLRKDSPALRPEDLNSEDLKKINQGLQDFTEEMKCKESSEKASNGIVEDLPPVRGKQLQINKEDTKPEAPTKKTVKPREYKEWDKFDIEKELNDVDKEEPKPAVKITEKIDTDVNLTGLSEEEKTLRANREKDKGNEAFRSNDHTEAVDYYTRSIKYVPLPASFNNRALAYIKLSKWPEAIADCNRVLAEEPDNVKAILRRGSAFKGLKDYQKAQNDFERVLELEANNNRAKDLLQELERQKKKDHNEKIDRQTKGRRMKIEEVEGNEEEDVGNDESEMTNVDSTENTAPPDSKKSLVTEQDHTAVGNDEVPQEPVIEVIDKPEVNQSSIETENEQINQEEQKTVNVPEERPVFKQHDLPPDVKEFRENGNTLYRSGQYGDAIVKYTDAIDNLIAGGGEQTVNLSFLYSNRAACSLKIGDSSSTVQDCTQALTLLPHSVKPLLRRAQAYETMERYSQAYVDFKHVLGIDSSYEMASQGSSRCSKSLQNEHGSGWRDKLLPIPHVNFYEIPIIEKSSLTQSLSSQSLTNLSMEATSATDTATSATDSTATTTPDNASSTNASNPVSSATSEETPSQSTPLSPEKKFDQMKSKGNQLVQKGDFREAVEYYSCCIELFPGRAVGFTNRALCYLRLNQAKKAEEDCTAALGLEAQNVKALFRRAQARKMLSQYKESLLDLSQLLKLDSKNQAAKREMDLVKKYYREELEKLKSVPADKPVSPSTGQSSKSTKKQRKRMVIEEVEDDSANQTSEKTQNSVEQRANKAVHEQKESKSSKNVENSKVSNGISSEVPRVPKLIKVTPYEFMQAWNSLKKTKLIKPYAQLLQQVPPQHIAMVISNKLDADMLTKIISSASQCFLPDGQADLAYQVLEKLTTVPRFQTMAMFMSNKEKQELSELLGKLSDRKSDVYTVDNISKLKEDYGVKS